MLSSLYVLWIYYGESFFIKKNCPTQISDEKYFYLLKKFEVFGGIKMETTLYARLTQGMDSFMRVSMTLRRREFKLKNISLSLEDNMMQMTVNEDESSSKSILNHLEKMYDVSDVTLEVKPVLSAVY